MRYQRLPSKPGSLGLSDPCAPCEGGKKTWLSSDFYMPGTQELEADWSAGRGYITGGGTLSCSLGREGPLLCVLGWVSGLQVSVRSSIKYQVTACQQPAQSASSKVQGLCSLQLALRAGRGHPRSELSAENRKGRSRAAEQWGSRSQER